MQCVEPCTVRPPMIGVIDGRVIDGRVIDARFVGRRREWRSDQHHVEFGRQLAQRHTTATEQACENAQLPPQTRVSDDRAQQVGVGLDVNGIRLWITGLDRRQMGLAIVGRRLAPLLAIALRGAIGGRLQRIRRCIRVDTERDRPVGALIEQRDQPVTGGRQPERGNQRLEVVASRMARRIAKGIEPAEPGLLRERRPLLGQLGALGRIKTQRTGPGQCPEPAVKRGDVGAARMREHGLVKAAGPPGQVAGARRIECIPVGQPRLERIIVGQRKQAQIADQALSHFVGRQPGKGDCKNLVGLRAVEQGPNDPSDQQRGFAAAGTGIDDDTVGRVDRCPPEAVLIDLMAPDAESPGIRRHDPHLMTRTS